ncbi:MAG: DUF1566 domain-containing protein [Deltaproteobacteria bacterium]|nr:DUF1566 domain-containing protein [Deltaproteobacteria bacterium]
MASLAIISLAPFTGHASAPAGRYAVSTDTVYDTATRLTWQRAVSSTTRSWADSKSYCASLSLAGFSSGWRLPTVSELETLVDRTTYNPAIDSTAFPGTQSEHFWSSSSTDAAGGGDAWQVYFYGGGSDWHSQSNYYFARCVR